ncbi:hypothetical protein HMPREF3182_00012 [Megasphaera hutchinsoni]|uniref:Uncharacterized protein n=1 Tax=Megasphaera hutchinsoni TaxID=1588748 RepID=A0A134CLK1_9FIRM|nr:hypothetical protein HMPREF3182_00012 [Megasphaera hutchinsoni]
MTTTSTACFVPHAREAVLVFMRRGVAGWFLSFGKRVLRWLYFLVGLLS